MEWDLSLECGVEPIDSEHRELFNAVERLNQTVKSENASEAAREILDFLGAYVVEHFGHEESLMFMCDYPQADEHKQLHQDFVQAFTKLRRKFDDDSKNPKVVTEVYYAAMSWLVNHIKIVDKRLVDYYLAQQSSD
jgi:hemerythrin-like metal-binding domain